MNTLLRSLFAITLLLSVMSCKKDNDNNPSDASIYVLNKHLLETDLPCFVNIMFEVTDGNGKGIPNLNTNDFEVLEDGKAVSPTESAMTVKNMDGIAYNMKTVLLLDNSASVGNNIQEIKNAAKDLVAKMVDQQEIAIYVFSEEAVLLQDFTSNVTDLNDAINSISIGYATTNLYGSIIAGVNRWEDYYSTESIEQGFMIAITDGSDTQGAFTLNDALSAIGNKKVYTVGLGSEQDVVALKQLGTSGYYELENFSDLSAKFIEIQDDIVAYAKSFYYLYYMSPKRGGNIHSLRLLVKENSNNSSSGYIDGEFSSEGFYSVEQGIVLNNGNENISLIYNDESYVTAFTYLATNNPSYVWESSNNDVFTVHPDNNDNSRCIIKATGNVGQTASLTVNDVSNSLMKSVVIEIAPNPYGEITDPRDGTTYKTVEIDGSLWIAENMRFEITPGSYVYDNDESNLQMLGRLYTWEKATLACPEGWHLPTNNDWQYLINYLGGNAEAGGKLKEQGTSNWKNPNSFATNESYFSARPGGFRNTDGTFVNKGEKGYFWSATNLNEIEAYSRGLSYDRKSVSVETSHKGIGFSVRCVKDQ